MRITILGEGPTTYLYYNAPVHSITMCISPGGMPVIPLYYEANVRGGMVAIAKHMDQLKLKPQVYLWRNDVAVIFKCKPLTLELLHTLYPHMPFEATSSINLDTELMAAAEADTDPEFMPLFRRFFKQKGYFALAIMQEPGMPQQKPPLWQTTITKYSSRSPEGMPPA